MGGERNAFMGGGDRNAFIGGKRPEQRVFVGGRERETLKRGGMGRDIFVWNVNKGSLVIVCVWGKGRKYVCVCVCVLTADRGWSWERLVWRSLELQCCSHLLPPDLHTHSK